jgi:hypothetical protein
MGQLADGPEHERLLPVAPAGGLNDAIEVAVVALVDAKRHVQVQGVDGGRRGVRLLLQPRKSRDRLKLAGGVGHLLREWFHERIADDGER